MKRYQGEVYPWQGTDPILLNTGARVTVERERSVCAVDRTGTNSEESRVLASMLGTPAP